MTLDAFEQQFFDNKFKSKKEMTKAFNELSIDDRLDFFDDISKEEKTKFISDIRTQAVKDFWTHEQSLIKEGKCTRDWTPEQIEAILNISEKTGIMSINGDKAVDINGKPYYGHHMLNVADYPEYAGDWRNIQALDYDEHYNGAHDSNTKNPTCSYYDPKTKQNFEIDETILEKSEDVKLGAGIVPIEKCIFDADKIINEKYANVGVLTDGERLTLKNIELFKTPIGTLKDYVRAFEVAERYKCNDFAKQFDLIPYDYIDPSYFEGAPDEQLESYLKILYENSYINADGEIIVDEETIEHECKSRNINMELWDESIDQAQQGSYNPEAIIDVCHEDFAYCGPELD